MTPAPTEAPAKARIYLSPPDVGPEERRLVEEAFATNWIAPVGPHLSAFEREMCEASGLKAALCLSSGTAALHLAVRLLGVEAGDEVFCSTFTFVASANPIVYQGARPVFIDSEERSWNMDPELLRIALADRSEAGRLPRAIIVTDLFGQCAEWEVLSRVAAEYGVPVIEDAAEAVGATYRGRWAGGFGRLGVYSFNGNKIITTSGGGMLVSDNPELIEHAAKLSTQAREPAPHFQHTELGYNYRLSNVLAGIGRGQLRSLASKVERRRQIFDFYQAALEDFPGVRFMPEPAGMRSNRWLTCLTIDPQASAVRPADLMAALADDNIEARPLWKPLHLQPLFRGVDSYGGAVSERLFERGVSLPSGSAMTDGDLQRVVEIIRRLFE
jgi:dTDP-4-amino-4,6-dideoxygalactose transaminase